MASAEVETTIAKAPDEVWALAGEFGGLETWMPGVEACDVDGDVRMISLMGMTIREELRERDATARRISYSITEAPMPVESHTATITVSPAGDGSRVTWTVDVTPDALLELMTGAYEGALDALKAKLEG